MQRLERLHFQTRNPQELILIPVPLSIGRLVASFNDADPLLRTHDDDGDWVIQTSHCASLTHPRPNWIVNWYQQIQSSMKCGSNSNRLFETHTMSMENVCPPAQTTIWFGGILLLGELLFPCLLRAVRRWCFNVQLRRCILKCDRNTIFFSEFEILVTHENATVWLQEELICRWAGGHG